MSARHPMPRMWDEERQHPLLLSIVYLVSVVGTLVFSLLFGSPAHAQATAPVVGLHVATQHLEHSTQNLNTATPGLYLRMPSGLTLGAFRNSDSHTSTYAGWTWETDDQRFAVTAGAITGYRAAKVMPLVVPSVRFSITEGSALRLAYIPKPMKHGSSSGLHLALETAL